MDYLFVYGSLQPGGANEHELAPYNGTWAAGRVRGHLYQEGWGYQQGYPGLVLDPHGPSVPGYVFTSARLGADWQTLDDFEGPEYERQLVSVTLESGEEITAYVYALREDARPKA